MGEPDAQRLAWAMGCGVSRHTPLPIRHDCIAAVQDTGWSHQGERAVEQPQALAPHPQGLAHGPPQAILQKIVARTEALPYGLWRVRAQSLRE